jgi:Tol biopolymer transport system component
MRVMLRVMAILMGVILLLMGGVMAVARARTETPPSAWVAFIHKANLYIMDVDGGHVRQITNESDPFSPLTPPVWSPRGDRLLITSVSPQPYYYSVYTLNPVGGEFHYLLEGIFSRYGLWADWSPDGQQVVIGAPRIPDSGADDVFVVDSNGSNLHRISNLESDPIYLANHPIWSPDGKWIVFAGKNVNIDESDNGIFRMQPDGSHLERFVPHWTDFADGFMWSPDGKWLLFQNYPNQLPVCFRVRADGTGVEQLLQMPDYFRQLAWSPDSNWITFISNDFEQKSYLEDGLFKVRPDGIEQPIMIVRADGISSYSWSPDGVWLYYVAFADANHTRDAIFRVRPDGTDIERLTKSYDYEYPISSPSIKTPFHPGFVLGAGLALVLAGVAPWSRSAWASRPQADHRKDRERPWLERP